MFGNYVAIYINFSLWHLLLRYQSICLNILTYLKHLIAHHWFVFAMICCHFLGRTRHIANGCSTRTYLYWSLPIMRWLFHLTLNLARSIDILLANHTWGLFFMVRCQNVRLIDLFGRLVVYGSSIGSNFSTLKTRMTCSNIIWCIWNGLLNWLWVVWVVID